MADKPRRTVNEARESMRDLFGYVIDEIGGSTADAISWDDYPKLSEDTRSLIRTKMSYYLANPDAVGSGTNTGHDLVVVTWNVKERYNTNFPPLSATQFQRLAQETDPDIVLLQEVTSCQQVAEIAGWLGMTHYIASDFTDDNTESPYEKLEVAIISKLDLVDSREFDFTPDITCPGVSESTLVPTVNPSTTTTRGFLEAVIPDQNLIVITTHLKSSGGDTGVDDHENAEKREAVASAIAGRVAILKAANPTYTILMGGDLNVSYQDPKTGSDLDDDATDGYDDTHHIFRGGVIDSIAMTPLTDGITGTFGETSGGAIDCFYVDGPGTGDYFQAYRASQRFESDHYPVVTGKQSSNGLTAPPSTDWTSDFNKVVEREWESQVMRWEDVLVDPRTQLSTEAMPEPWPSRDGARFWIGPIPVMDPSPLDITIVQNYDVSESGTLRTETEPLVRGDKVRTRIDVDVLYPNADKVNSDFRQTLAALKGCPFTILRGPMIKEALLKKFDNDEAFELAVKAVENDAKSEEYRNDLVSMWGTVRKPDGGRTQFLEGDTTALQNIRDQLKRGAPAAERIEILRQVYEESKSFNQDSALNPNVTVMFSGVRATSVPDTPKALRVRYSFWMVNDLTVSEYGVKFRDGEGNPTTDIKKAVWLKKFIEDTYLTQGKPTYLPPISDSDNNRLIMTYSPPSHLPDYDDPDFSFVFTTDVKFVDQNKLGGSDFNSRYCEYVVAGFDTKCAIIPIEGEDDPGAQYMGRKNASGRISITCDLDGVRALTHLKNSIQHWLRHNIKREREHWVTVDNPVLNVMGVNRVIITNIVYKPVAGQPGRYAVDLDWVENRVRASARETLVYHSAVLHDNLLKSLMEYLWTVYEDWQSAPARRQTSDPEVQGMLKFIFGGKVRAYEAGFSYGDSAIGNIMDGVWSEDSEQTILGDYGVFNRDVIRAATFTNSDYIKQQKDYLALTWFTKHYDGNMALFDDHIQYGIKEWGHTDAEKLRKEFGKTYNYIFSAYKREEFRTPSIQRYYGLNKAERSFASSPFILTDMGGSKYIQERMLGLVSPYFDGDIVNGFRDRSIFFGKEGIDDIKEFNRFYRDLRSGAVAIKKPGWDKMVDVILNMPSSREYKHSTIDPLAPVRGPNGADLWMNYRSPKSSQDSTFDSRSFTENMGHVLTGFGLGEAIYDQFTGAGSKPSDRWNIRLALAGVTPNAIGASDSPWDDQSIVAAYRILRAGVLFVSDQFPGWKDREKALDASGGKLVPITRNGKKPTSEQLAQLSCYPDMFMPKYIDLFSVDGRLNPVWKKFAPKWSELGKIPPPREFSFTAGKAMYEQLAVDEESLVDPSFFYYSVSFKQKLLDAERSVILDTIIGQAIQGSTLKVNWDFGGDQSNLGGENIGDIMSYLRKADTETGDGNTLVQDRLNQLRGTKLKKGQERLKHVYLMASNRAVPIARLVADPNTEEGYKIELIKGRGRKVYDVDGTEIIDTEDPEEVKARIDKATSEIKDDKFSVRRMFPTFRVRFIDFASGWYTDNLYDYNAIRSISITKDKYDADLAILELMNITGALDNDRFLTKRQIRKLGIDPSEEPKTKSDKTQGQIFRTIKLREGTAIQILLGYYNDPNLLDVVFTGRVSQINPGDIVTIVAQGYKTELLNEISWKQKDLTQAQVVQSIFKSLDGEDMSGDDPDDNIPDPKDRVNGTPHLGSRPDMMTEKQGRKLVSFMKDQFGDENVDIQYISPEQKWYGRAIDSPYWLANKAIGVIDEDWKTKNSSFGIGMTRGVPVASVQGHRFTDLFTDNPDRLRNIYFTNTEGGSLEWVNVYQPAFDALQELTHFTPGWVCEVLPADHLATLYIGPPEGDYYWTSKYKANIVQQLKTSPRPIKSTTPQIVDVLKELGFHIRKQTAMRLDPLVNIDDGFWMREGNFLNISDPEIEKLSTRLGNLTNKFKTLEQDQPGLVKYAIPAFFGFDMIEDENMPLEIRREFWQAVTDILSNQGKDYLSDNWDIIPGFKTPYTSLRKSSNPDIEGVVDGLAFANWHTEYEPGYGSARRVNANDETIHRGLTKDAPFLTIKDPTGRSIPEVVVGNTTITITDRVNHITKTLDYAQGGQRERTNSLTAAQWVRDNFPQYEVTPGINMDPGVNEIFTILGTESKTEGATVWRKTEEFETTSIQFGKFMRWDGTILEKMTQYYEVFRWWFNQFYTWTMKTNDLEESNLKDYEARTKALRAEGAEVEAPPESRLKVLNESLSDDTWSKARPDRRSFRDYHLVTSRTDIISNNIVASTKEMHNAVLVRYPGTRSVSTTEGGVTTAQGGRSDTHFIDHAGTTWKDLMGKQYGIPFHKNLKLEERKLLISLEKNAFFHNDGYGRGTLRDFGWLKDANEFMAAGAFLNLMGDALRPMYRGNIHLWGRTMKPHDWVRLIDLHNEMRGMFEVEKVVHNFNSNTGWTTTVVPQAVVHVNNAVAHFVGGRVAKNMATLNKVLELWEMAEWALLAWSLAGGVIKKVGGFAMRKVGGYAARKFSRQVAAAKALKNPMKSAAVKQTSKATVASADGQLLADGLKSSGYMNMLTWVNQKMGVNFAGAFRHFMGAETAMLLKEMSGYITETLTVNDIPDLNGVVSLTPLIYQGRPFVAGLKMDDHVYLTRWKQLWKSAGELVDTGINNMTDFIQGDDEDDIPEMDDYIDAQIRTYGG